MEVTKTYSSTSHYEGYYSSAEVLLEVGKEVVRAAFLHTKLDPHGVGLAKLARVFRG